MPWSPNSGDELCTSRSKPHSDQARDSEAHHQTEENRASAASKIRARPPVHADGVRLHCVEQVAAAAAEPAAFVVAEVHRHWQDVGSLEPQVMMPRMPPLRRDGPSQVRAVPPGKPL
jgi:hypothetical protein